MHYFALNHAFICPLAQRYTAVGITVELTHNTDKLALACAQHHSLYVLNGPWGPEAARIKPTLKLARGPWAN